MKHDKKPNMIETELIESLCAKMAADCYIAIERTKDPEYVAFWIECLNVHERIKGDKKAIEQDLDGIFTALDGYMFVEGLTGLLHQYPHDFVAHVIANVVTMTEKFGNPTAFLMN